MSHSKSRLGNNDKKLATPLSFTAVFEQALAASVAPLREPALWHERCFVPVVAASARAHSSSRGTLLPGQSVAPRPLPLDLRPLSQTMQGDMGRSMISARLLGQSWPLGRACATAL